MLGKLQVGAALTAAQTQLVAGRIFTAEVLFQPCEPYPQAESVSSQTDYDLYSPVCANNHCRSIRWILHTSPGLQP